MTDTDAAAHMRRALELARRGWGMTRPNPMVGAVVVRNGEVVGEGWHERYGGPHAEVNALRAAGEAARGATLYVTLEPCAHHGRTPPCTQAVLDAGVSDVVIAIADPNPKARGGAQLLRDNGIRVLEGVEHDAARRLNADFFVAHEQQRPFITLKLAQSLDGALGEHGRRTAITGDDANAETHRMRAQHDAILVGIGTVLADDPLLTVRGAPCIAPPRRIILDTHARLPLASQLVRTLGLAPVTVVCAEGADTAHLEAAGVHVLRIPRAEHGLDIRAATDALHNDGIRSIFVEGGAHVADSFTAGRMVHRMHIFIAPVTLGRDAVRAFSDYAALHGWEIVDLERFGRDVMLTLEEPESR